MKVVILRGADRSFAFRNNEGLGINIADGDDIIKVFQLVNSMFKSLDGLFILSGVNCYE